MTTGERIAEKMEGLKLNKSQLAYASNVSESYIGQLIRDKVKSPSAAFMVRIAEALETDVYELLGAEPISKVCGTCRFYIEISKRKKIGQCHRYPPQVDSPKGLGFTDVVSETFCGEWKPKVLPEVNNEIETSE